jgi:ABC-type sugar transport system ATPase subunit
MEEQEVQEAPQEKKLTLEDYQSEQASVQAQIEGLKSAIDGARQQLGELIIRHRELVAVIKALSDAQKEA